MNNIIKKSVLEISQKSSLVIIDTNPMHLLMVLGLATVTGVDPVSATC